MKSLTRLLAALTLMLCAGLAQAQGTPTKLKFVLDWKFQGLHAWTGRNVSLAIGNERPDQIFAATTTPGWITNFGLQFQLGRDFLPEEGQVGNDTSVILCHSLWQERWGN